MVFWKNESSSVKKKIEEREAYFCKRTLASMRSPMNGEEFETKQTNKAIYNKNEKQKKNGKIKLHKRGKIISRFD
jgi:hypothetical protein